MTASKHSVRFRAAAAVWLPCLLAGLLSSPVEAGQQPGAGRPGPDFLLRPPKATLGVRGTWSFARGGSDWYDFVTEHLTLGRGDFDAPGIGGEIAIPITNRAAVVAGVDFHRSAAISEYRDYVDDNRLPITQQTRVRQVHVAGSVRVALLPPGRRIGQFVWIPRRVAPYTGGGAGIVRFDLEHYGDFVDVADLSIFRNFFAAGGWAPSAHAFGGTTVQIHGRLQVTVEGRYVWARSPLGPPWIDFEPLDLSVLRLATGIGVSF